MRFAGRGEWIPGPRGARIWRRTEPSSGEFHDMRYGHLPNDMRVCRPDARSAAGSAAAASWRVAALARMPFAPQRELLVSCSAVLLRSRRHELRFAARRPRCQAEDPLDRRFARPRGSNVPERRVTRGVGPPAATIPHEQRARRPSESAWCAQSGDDHHSARNGLEDGASARGAQPADDGASARGAQPALRTTALRARCPKTEQERAVRSRPKTEQERAVRNQR